MRAVEQLRNLTDNELSAAVAVARGEVEKKTIRTRLDEKKFIFMPVDDIVNFSGVWVDPEPDFEPWADAYQHIKPYATDMNEAWGLVGEMTEETHNVFSVETTKKTFEAKLWFKGKSTGWIEASTMPRAISIAYLEWKNAQG